MSGAEDAAAWDGWQAQLQARAFAAADAREAAEDRAAERERLGRIEDRRDRALESFRAGLTGRPERTIAGVLHDLASVPDKAWWDPGAERGSERNPAPLYADPAPKAERAARASQDEQLLARARELHNDPFMRRELMRFHQRGAGQEAARAASGWGAAYSEITR